MTSERASFVIALLEQTTRAIESLVREKISPELARQIADVWSLSGESVRELSRESDLERARAASDEILGISPAIMKLRDSLPQIARSKAPVLILGENGTGKEGIARAIVAASPRASKPLVTLNCGAFQDTLLESELFGFVKGAFTGAADSREGMFARADGGTLFLDEIGDTSPAMQVKLLRVLQSGTFMPVGSEKQRKVDVRIVAATNRDLPSMIKKGTFRQDLFYRINVLPVVIPPLRSRKEDIPILAEGLLERHRLAEGHVLPKSLSPRAIKQLQNHDWPGNVRELENVVVRMLVFSGLERVLDTPGLPTEFQTTPGAENLSLDLEKGIEALVAEYERTIIRAALGRHKGIMTAAAMLLGLTQTGLKKKMDRLGVQAPLRKSA